MGKTVWKRYLLPLLIFLAAAAVFFWIVRESWTWTALKADAVNRAGMAENVGGETEATQRISVLADQFQGVSLDLYVENPEQTGRIAVIFQNEAGEQIGRIEKGYDTLVQDGMNEFLLEEPLTDLNGKTVILHIHTDGGIRLGYGHSVSAGKLEVEVETPELLLIGGEAMNGSLRLKQIGRIRLTAAERFWPVVFILCGIMMVILIGINAGRKKGKKGLLQRAEDFIRRYRYLLKQLVLRDFKIKYKASVLGVFWSFLNPLLMTLVYHLVFSNLFSSQENFVVYLMTGTVLFNYVSESTTLGLNAIVGNAGLITKVYIPKFIYPLSKVLSSAINLVISMIPMMVLMLLTHLPFTKGLLLLPILVFLLILFCTGLSCILSTCMVFFRDTQFLWAVLLLMWNFLSPVFYPESIIPASIIGIYRMNPLYQYMTFMRSIVLYGTAPDPGCFGYCLAASLASLGIGLLIFRKYQNRFATYL